MGYATRSRHGFLPGGGIRGADTTVEAHTRKIAK